MSWTIGYSNPARGKRHFSSASLQTGSRAHPRLTINGHRSSFLVLKRPGGSVEHPPLRRTDVKARVELQLCSPYEPVWRVKGNLSLHLFIPYLHLILFLFLCSHFYYLQCPITGSKRGLYQPATLTAGKDNQNTPLLHDTPLEFDY